MSEKEKRRDRGKEGRERDRVIEFWVIKRRVSRQSKEDMRRAGKAVNRVQP